LATPLITLRRDEAGESDLAQLASLVEEHEVVEVVVGLPMTLAGRHGPAAEAAKAYGDALAERIAPVPVRFVDERLTTVSASRMLSKRGVRGKKQRAVVDQAAAVEILQTWLDTRGQRTREDLSCTMISDCSPMTPPHLWNAPPTRSSSAAASGAGR